MNGYTALCFLGTAVLGVYLWLADRKEWRRAIEAQQNYIDELESELDDLDEEIRAYHLAERKQWQWN